jgi:hypothetical protein
MKVKLRKHKWIAQSNEVFNTMNVYPLKKESKPGGLNSPSLFSSDSYVHKIKNRGEEI